MPCCQNSVVEKFLEDTQQHVCGDLIVKLESFRFRCGFTFLYTILTQADRKKVSYRVQAITHQHLRRYFMKTMKNMITGSILTTLLLTLMGTAQGLGLT